MIWIEAKVRYEAENREIAKDIISSVFYDIGVQGVALEEPMGRNKLDYYADEKNMYFDSYAVKGYFPKNNYIDSKLNFFEENINKKCEENEIIISISYSEFDEKEWEEGWKKYFNPEKITERIVVKPTWKEYEPKDGEVIIEIDPGMAFGTGTHPTTYLCMNMIEKYLKSGDTLLDIGTGSGILMLAGAKLGASKITGTDIDDVAVEVADTNMKLNNISADIYSVKRGNLAETVQNEKYDVVVSNILAEVILILLEDISKHIKEGGYFISSGIIKDKKESVIRKMEEIGFSIVETREKEEWVSIVGRYKI